MNKPLYAALLGFTVLATLGGLLTLLPWESASYPNVLGYKSLCTFAPAATLFCFFLAGLSCHLRAALVKDQDGGTPGQKLNHHAQAWRPLGLLLVLALGATVWFGAVKTSYANPDAGTAVTAEG